MEAQRDDDDHDPLFTATLTRMDVGKAHKLAT